MTCLVRRTGQIEREVSISASRDEQKKRLGERVAALSLAGLDANQTRLRGPLTAAVWTRSGRMHGTRRHALAARREFCHTFGQWSPRGGGAAAPRGITQFIAQ